MLRYLPPRGPERLPFPAGFDELRRAINRGEISGPRALLLTLLLDALQDYCRGSEPESEAARWFLANERGDLDALLSALDLPPGMFVGDLAALEVN